MCLVKTLLVLIIWKFSSNKQFFKDDCFLDSTVSLKIFILFKSYALEKSNIRRNHFYQ